MKSNLEWKRWLSIGKPVDTSSLGAHKQATSTDFSKKSLNIKQHSWERHSKKEVVTLCRLLHTTGTAVQYHHCGISRTRSFISQPCFFWDLEQLMIILSQSVRQSVIQFNAIEERKHTHPNDLGFPKKRATTYVVITTFHTTRAFHLLAISFHK